MRPDSSFPIFGVRLQCPAWGLIPKVCKANVTATSAIRASRSLEPTLFVKSYERCHFSERIERLRYTFVMTVIQRNNVNVTGTGEPVLMFAHGYGCDQNMWRYLTPDFSDKYRIVLFDFVGSGLSATSAFDRTRYSTLKGYAQDVLEIVEELNFENVHFVGHSVSSMIGALASIQEPSRFATLTMIGPSASYINDGDYHGGFERVDIEGLLDALDTNHTAWSAMMAPTIMGNTDRPELSAELEASFCRMDPLLAHHFAKVTFLSDNRADLSLVRTKALILQCQKDAIADLRVGEYVHQCLPESQFVVMDATGHCPHMSHPKEVAKAMKEFLP
jgi:sigma-B regulation protein RsbQ